MPVSAETLSKLVSLGVSGQDLIDVVALIDRDMGWPIVAEPRQVPTPSIYNSDKWLELRNAIIIRDGWSCAYCEDHEVVTLTADHVIPLSRGGSNDPGNLVCACVPCNSSKRNLLLSEWSGRSTARIVRDFSYLIDGIDA